jgi:uncharacterized protein (TIGR02453 family)
MSRFSQKSLDFIARAAKQKSPEWLDRNKEEYESVLVEPMKQLVSQVAKNLMKKAPGYRFPSRQFVRLRRSADRAKAQGWYKNWVSLMVNRDSGSRYEDLPSLYFHISKDEFFSAGGLYMPSAGQTKKIRLWIDQDPSALEKLLSDKDFKRRYKELGKERVLKTKPRDYPIDHPRIEWLKLSAWYVWRDFSKKELFSPKFSDILTEDWNQVLRLNQILDKYTTTLPKEKQQAGLETSDLCPPKVDWDADF